MKTNYLVFFIIAAFILNACTAGVNKDLLSGLKLTNNGLSYKEGYLSKAKVKVTDTEFAMRDTVYLFLSGIEGYTEKEGRVFMGASMVITDPDGKKVMDEQDLFSSYDQTGASKEDASVLSLSLITGEPMVAGVKYLWKSRIWDKNGKGVIEAEVEFMIK